MDKCIKHWKKIREAISSSGCCGILCEAKSNRHALTSPIRLSTEGKIDEGIPHLFVHHSRSEY